MSDLTAEQIAELSNNPAIRAGVEASKVQADRVRAADLMLLGYNYALQERGLWPDGHTRESWQKVVEGMAQRLGVEI